MTDTEALQALKKTVIEQKKAALPLEPAEAALETVHQALVHYDTLVSQLVIGIIQHIDFPLPAGALDQAERSAEQALQETQANGLQRYRSYKIRLDSMRSLAEQVQQEQADA